MQDVTSSRALRLALCSIVDIVDCGQLCGQCGRWARGYQRQKTAIKEGGGDGSYISDGIVMASDVICRSTQCRDLAGPGNFCIFWSFCTRIARKLRRGTRSRMRQGTTFDLLVSQWLKQGSQAHGTTQLACSISAICWICWICSICSICSMYIRCFQVWLDLQAEAEQRDDYIKDLRCGQSAPHTLRHFEFQHFVPMFVSLIMFNHV